MKLDMSRAMKVILTFEGGKVDDPKDPGGRTNQGITQRVYSAWRINNGLPVQDVYLMADTERDSIYDVQYARKIKFDDLPAGVDLVIFNGAVNSGVAQVVKWTQRSLPLYTGKIDGIMGEGTFQAIRSVNDYDKLVGEIVDRQEMFLKALKTFSRYGRGWTRRCEQVRTIGQAWASGTTGPDPIYYKDMHNKAELSDAKTIPSTGPGSGMGGIGVATASSTAVLGQIKDQLAPVATISPVIQHLTTYVDHAGIILTSVGGLVAIAGGAWAVYANNRAKQLHDALDTHPVAAVAKSG